MFERASRMGAIAAALLALSAGCSAEGDDGGGTGTTPPVAGVSGAAGAPLAGAPAAGAGAGGSVSGTGGSAGVGIGTAGVGGAAGAAGIGGAAGMAGVGGAGGAAGMMAAAGSGGLPPLDGPSPTLPPIAGMCPDFVDGTTIMVAGHGGVAIAAGAKGMGGPLLFYWHGTGGSSAEAMRTLPASVRMEILSAGGIIAAFNGDDSSGTAGDCSGTGAHNIADFEAADQIAACAVMNYGIDARRIYSTGCSAGGLQTGCMAILRSSYIAAAAPNSGGIVGQRMWQDEHTPAIFTMHGGDSDMVIVLFADTSRALDMSAKTHGSFVVNCNHGGGHCRAPAELQVAAWQFMKDHPWGFTPPSPWMTAFPAGVPDYCAVF